jgi:hypothetical protein
VFVFALKEEINLSPKFFFHLFGFDIARQILIEKERNIYIDFFSVTPRFIDEEDYDN